uniref:G-protein coupled receptors family 1 profile domain-containing protein n=1 Tax=Amazona collaria TaxID=241587 RepID=A0A8B9G439_9PSIT
MSEKKSIAYAECVAQVFLFDLFAITECFLLASMAYDRYVAICHPLLYPIVLSPKRCFQLVAGSYLMGLTSGVGQTISMSTLSFCSSTSLFGVSSILGILISYVAIITTVLSINSAEGKRKAFSTCTSHLIAVSILYGACFFMYLFPRSHSSRGTDKWAVVLYSMVTPMLNPLIYSLRNKEVKEALRRLLKIK